MADGGRDGPGRRGRWEGAGRGAGRRCAEAKSSREKPRGRTGRVADQGWRSAGPGSASQGQVEANGLESEPRRDLQAAAARFGVGGRVEKSTPRRGGRARAVAVLCRAPGSPGVNRVARSRGVGWGESRRGGEGARAQSPRDAIAPEMGAKSPRRMMAGVTAVPAFIGSVQDWVIALYRLKLLPNSGCRQRGSVVDWTDSNAPRVSAANPSS